MVKVKAKVCSYIAQTVSCPLDRISPPDRPVHSDINTTSLGSIHPCCNYCAKTIHSISIAVASYSFLQLGELGHRGENKNDQASKQQQMGLKPGLTRMRVPHSTVRPYASGLLQ